MQETLSVGWGVWRGVSVEMPQPIQHHPSHLAIQTQSSQAGPDHARGWCSSKNELVILVNKVIPWGRENYQQPTNCAEGDGGPSRGTGDVMSCKPHADLDGVGPLDMPVFFNDAMVLLELSHPSHPNELCHPVKTGSFPSPRKSTAARRRVRLNMRVFIGRGDPEGLQISLKHSETI